jgi:hypothetical protein
MISDGNPVLPTADSTSRELVSPTASFTASVDCHRAAEIDRQVSQVPGLELDVDFLEQPGQAQVDRPVDDNPQRTVLVVLADVDEAVREIGVFQRRHGDQEVVGQVDAVHGWNFNPRRGTNQP